MDWTAIIIAAIGVLGVGGGGIAYLVYHKQEARLREARAHREEAEADGIDGSNYQAVIDTLQSQYDRLASRFEKRITELEARVSALERENYRLRTNLRKFRRLLRELWDLVIEHDVSVTTDLERAVVDALKDAGD